MIPEKMKQVLQKEGVVAIATQGDDGPHLVNSWNSYLKLTEDNSLLIPAGFMHKTEENIAKNKQVLLTLGSRDVEGNHGPGTGFLIKGTASFMKEGTDFEDFKLKFPWMRAILKVEVTSAQQTL